MASPTLVVAIDFGTAYSGYAYSFNSEPNNVHVNKNWAKNLVSLKTPTSVLVDPDKTFHSFGYEAELMYSDLLEEEQGEGWALFRKFKMKIDDIETLTDTTELADVSTLNPLPALKVFAMAVKYLKDHALNSLTQKVSEESIRFVVTVPAIWSESSRRFMREAAIEAGISLGSWPVRLPSNRVIRMDQDLRLGLFNGAGINGDRLVLALEPEAASAWCQNIPLFNGKTLTTPGTKFMVVDLGGGTADITNYQVLRNNKLKELHQATGGKWGGIEVDKQFIALLTQVLGKETMQRFARECLYDLFDLLREFEVTKRTISSSMKGKFSIRLPASLRQINTSEMMESRKMFLKTLKASDYGEKLIIRGDTLRINDDVARNMYKYSIDSLISHLKAHECIREVDIILCVGGFSECELIQRALLDSFPEKKLAFPESGGLAVLKGAVLFGHQPGIIAIRKAKFTYGISTMEKFDEEKHSVKQKRIIDNEAMCVGLFKKYVTIREEVTSGYTIVETGLLPDTADGMNVVCNVYLSTDTGPVYVTDPTCKTLGEFHVKLPFEKEPEDRAYERSLVFGNTEIMVIVKHLKSGKIFRKYFNFL